MQFSTSAIAAALLGLASAQKVHVVSVSSSKTKALTFSPDNLKAAVGDMIQFQFLAGNHSVVQSNFDNPCSPIQQHDTTQTGLFSGYMDVAAGLATGNIPVYTMEVKTEKPLWLYCSQGKHCQSGMVMVVNENTAANATRSLAEFKKLAGQAPDNIDPTEIPGAGSGSDDTTGGTSSTIPSPTGSGTPDATGSSTPTATPEKALGSMVSVSAWMGLLSVAAVLTMF